MGTIEAIWRFAAMAIRDLPEHTQLALAGLLLSLVLTQWLKSFLCLRGRWLAVVALLVAFVPCAIFSRTAAGAMAALIAGLASPLAYKIAIMGVRRKWPELAIALSKDSPSYSLSDWLSGSRPSLLEVGLYLRSRASRSPKARAKQPSRH